MEEIAKLSHKQELDQLLNQGWGCDPAVDLIYEQKALEVLYALEQAVTDGKKLTMVCDYSLGAESAVIIDLEGDITRIGYDTNGDEPRNLSRFVDGLYKLFVIDGWGK